MANRTMMMILAALLIGVLVVTNFIVFSVPLPSNIMHSEDPADGEANSMNINKESAMHPSSSFSTANGASSRPSSASSSSKPSSASSSSSQSSSTQSSLSQNQDPKSPDAIVMMVGAISGQEAGKITLDEAKERNLEVKQ